MDILIAYERNQLVTNEFRALGFNAYSCDIKECAGDHPEWHIRNDAEKVITGHNWLFIGLHLPCTKLAVSGNRTYGKHKPRYAERLNALDYSVRIWNKARRVAKHVYLENPVGALNGDSRMPRLQTIHPYYFGDEFQKITCLFLHNLLYLVHNKTDDLFGRKTHVSKGEFVTFASGKQMPKWYAETASTNSEKNREVRNRTFPGIAKAIAHQWGDYINNSNLKKA